MAHDNFKEIMDMWRKTTSLEVYMLRYPPMTARSEVDHLSIYTDKEVVFLHNFDFIPPPPFFSEIYLFFPSIVGGSPSEQ